MFVNILAFTGYELRSIGSVKRRTNRGISLETLRTLRSLNTCSVAKTHRGSTAGVNNFQPIPTVITRDRKFPKVPLPDANDVRISTLITLQQHKQCVTQTPIFGRLEDTARTVSHQRSVCTNVASVTTSQFVPHDTSVKNVSIRAAVTTILPATETSALAATQVSLADDDNVNVSCKFDVNPPSGLRFVQWNARGVYPKIDEL